jgi:pimeloyl-ACP methyl ester carboxylesterase
MLRRLAYWALDYVFALEWQIRSLSRRRPPAYHQGRPGKAPIILIPGVYEPWPYLLPLAQSLHQAGHPVYFVQELGYHTMQIPAAAETVRRLIDRHCLRDAVLIAHSKGGLVGKYALAHLNSDDAIARLIAIAAPFSGSVYASFWIIPAVRVFSPRSPIIRELVANAAANTKIISIYGQFDPHIPGGSYLEGATNIELPVMGHFRILGQAALKQAVLGQLG